MKVVDIADELFRELGEPDDTSIPAISFWLLSNIGKLNTVLDLEILIVNNEFEPALSEEQKVIIKKLYEISYFGRQINKNLGAAAYTSVLELKEGNRTVRRTNRNEVAKSYASFAKELRDELSDLILAYKLNHADPAQVLNSCGDEYAVWTPIYPHERSRTYLFGEA